jgi:hypothetical protein
VVSFPQDYLQKKGVNFNEEKVLLDSGVVNQPLEKGLAVLKVQWGCSFCRPVTSGVLVCAKRKALCFDAKKAAV